MFPSADREYPLIAQADVLTKLPGSSVAMGGNQISDFSWYVIWRGFGHGSHLVSVVYIPYIKTGAYQDRTGDLFNAINPLTVGVLRI